MPPAANKNAQKEYEITANSSSDSVKSDIKCQKNAMKFINACKIIGNHIDLVLTAKYARKKPIAVAKKNASVLPCNKPKNIELTAIAKPSPYFLSAFNIK